MKKYIALGILCCIIFTGCANETKYSDEKEEIGSSISLSDETLKDELESNEQDPEFIGVFEKAEYDKFNSYASENGLGDTLIYIDGIVLNQTIFDNSDSEIPLLALVVEQEDGNRWSVSVPSNNKIERIEGKNVRIFGTYMGFSDVMNLPAMGLVAVDDENKARIDIEENGEYVTVWSFSDYVEKEINKQEENTEAEKFNEEEPIIYQDNNVIITYTGITGKESKYNINFVIENLSEKTLTVQARETSINGYMVDPLCSIQIAPGKKAIDGMTIWSDDAENHPMSSVENVETKFHIFNDYDWSDSYDTENIIIVGN